MNIKIMKKFIIWCIILFVHTLSFISTVILFTFDVPTWLKIVSSITSFSLLFYPAFNYWSGYFKKLFDYDN